MYHPIYCFNQQGKYGNMNLLDWLVIHANDVGLDVYDGGDCFIVNTYSPELVRSVFGDDWNKFNGLIISKVNGEILCHSIDSELDITEFANKVAWKDVIIEEYLEGTLIQCFYHPFKQQWQLASKCRADLDHRWSSKKTFFELFDEIINTQELFKVLDTNFSYAFLLVHSDNIIINPSQNDMVYHLESRNMETGICYNIDLGLPKPTRFRDNLSYDDPKNYLPDFEFNFSPENWVVEMREYIEKEKDWRRGGYILFDTFHNWRTHIKPHNWSEVQIILDSISHPDMKYKIMKLHKDERWGSIATLLNRCPHIRSDYEWVQDKYFHVISMLYRLYVDIYIEKKVIVMSKEQWLSRHLLFRLHSIYLDHVKKGIRYSIDFNDIMNCIEKKCSSNELWSIFIA
jgi:hypothetical protein